jgi:hypothetical protein
LPVHWREHIVMLGDPSREYEHVQSSGEYPSLVQGPAVYSASFPLSMETRNKGNSFDLQKEHEAFAYAAHHDRFNGGPQGKNVVYLPVHKSCLRIALKAPMWDQVTPPVTPLHALFRILRHRFQVSWEQSLADFNPSTDDFQFWAKYQARPIVFGGFQNTGGIERGYCHKSNFVPLHQYDRIGELYCRSHPEDDPFYIPALTETLLKNLEPRVTDLRSRVPGSFNIQYIVCVCVGVNLTAC